MLHALAFSGVVSSNAIANQACEVANMEARKWLATVRTASVLIPTLLVVLAAGFDLIDQTKARPKPLPMIGVLLGSLATYSLFLLPDVYESTFVNLMTPYFDPTRHYRGMNDFVLASFIAVNIAFGIMLARVLGKASRKTADSKATVVILGIAALAWIFFNPNAKIAIGMRPLVELGGCI